MARGRAAAQPMREVSTTDATKALVTESDNLYVGDKPGASLSKGLFFEGLGFLNDFPRYNSPQNHLDGFGDYYIVSLDLITGAEGKPYSKGSVRRLSHFINDYGNKEIMDSTDGAERIKSNISRLIGLEAIRPATLNEIDEAKENGGIANIVFESREVAEEKSKRVSLEREVEVLKAKLAEATKAQQNATPFDPNAPVIEVGGEGTRDVSDVTGDTEDEDFFEGLDSNK